ncbi:TPA: hypothetical protein ACIPUI_004302 [Citrobacter freundii]
MEIISLIADIVLQNITAFTRDALISLHFIERGDNYGFSRTQREERLLGTNAI